MLVYSDTLLGKDKEIDRNKTDKRQTRSKKESFNRPQQILGKYQVNAAISPSRAHALPHMQEKALDPDEQQETAVQEKVKKATKAPAKPKRATSKRKRWFEASEFMLRGLPEGVAKRKAAKKGKRKRSEKTTKSVKTAAKKVLSFCISQSNHHTHARRVQPCACRCIHIYPHQAKVEPEAEPLNAEARILSHPTTHCSLRHIVPLLFRLLPLIHSNPTHPSYARSHVLYANNDAIFAQLQAIKQTVFGILEVVDKTKMTMREVGSCVQRSFPNLS